MSSYNDFLVHYGPQIKTAVSLLKKARKKFSTGELSEDRICDALENKVESVYDAPVAEFIDRVVTSPNSYLTYDAIADVAHQINGRYGTERRMVINAIEDFCSYLDIYEDDED